MASPWSWKFGPPFSSTLVADPARIWHRRLWGGEIIFAQATHQQPGRGDGMISCTIEPPTSSSLSHADARAAMRHLRFKHPSIASRVAWDGAEARFVYEAPRNEGDVENWLDEMTIQHVLAKEDNIEDALGKLRSKLAHANTPRTNHELLLHHITPCASGSNPRVHGLLIYMHHSVFDGLAAWQVLDCILQEVARAIGGGEKYARAPLAWGEEHVRLARPVSDRTNNKWRTEDMNMEWPLVKRMHDVLQRPSTSFGLPVPYPNEPLGRTDWITRSYPSSLSHGLVEAAREGGAKSFALQFAMILIACLRVSPPDASQRDHSITMPFNPVNLRPLLSVLPPNQVEIVSAIGFKALEATNLLRFGDSVKNGAGPRSDAEVRRAVLTLAREVQVQSDAQEAGQGDAARFAPLAMKILGEAMFLSPPPSHPLKVFGITNFGVLDSIIKPSYPTASSPSSPQLKVTAIFFHSVMFYLPNTLLPVILHAYTWQGTLTYAYSYSPAHMGQVNVASIGSSVSNVKNEESGEELLGRFIGELERIMVVMAREEREEEVRSRL